MNYRHIILFLVLAIAIQVYGETPALVGTWRKKDKSLVELKSDGTITTDGKSVAKWQAWPQPGTPHLFLVRFASDIAKYKTWVEHYQRRLVVEHPGNGKRTILERVDNGPTRNPDVPDERTALGMEVKDIEGSIADLQNRLPKVQAEAADLGRQHWAARAIGRISTHNIRAQALDASAGSMAASIRGLQARQLEVQSMLAR